MDFKTNSNISKINPDRNVLLDGFANPRAEVMLKHPLEVSEKNYKERMDAINMSIARRVQGVHAPLRLMMERKAASSVGRLPFLPSSNLMLDTLEDRNECIDFEDIFNDPAHIEVTGPPHMVMERKLGLL